MKKEINIGLVEDQVLFREGMKAIINTWQDMKVIFESADGYSVPDKLRQAAVLPDVMLVDLSLPPDGDKEYSGQHVTQALADTYPEMKILILSVHDDENFINQLIQCGAHGYLVKDSAPQEVQEAIIAVHTKGSYINERALKALQLRTVRAVRSKPQNLSITKREEEILQLVCRQYTAEEIAQELFISVKTVNGHRNNLLQKTGSRNVTGLVLYAIRNNIVSLK
ncbi:MULTISPECIES: response regulator transcription factor [Chitinophaga]|uniref:response regulator transcription factor n=1 Tax=Chitinophaga TaxID=79328 RepID=UPI000DB92680|nr:response regulator transcription factor [Chitinophaga ginsengisegetis]MDR6569029.1 DNA-binding NarL/FixJ family response regulator [Chitinophaga ginsengisegetis]MDR6648942.1 DNA-binding NarL/FixJ family response regulator [Chitinophaga ginsengisegetis]MDR6655110.1 DNA-binding NarL/FixJ family response regulator [Chitinophaga ginsengisegetis]